MGGERGRANWNSSYSSYNLKKVERRYSWSELAWFSVGQLSSPPIPRYALRFGQTTTLEVFSPTEIASEEHTALCVNLQGIERSSTYLVLQEGHMVSPLILQWQSTE